MLEIYFIWRLVVHIGKLATEKGLKKFRFQLMVVLLWLSLETTAITIGMTFLKIEGYRCLISLIGLTGGLIGAGLSLLIMRLIPGENGDRQTDLSANHEETEDKRKFGMSFWIPFIAIIAAITACGVSCGIAIVSELTEEIRAVNGVIGIELDESENIVQYQGPIPSDTEIIYFGCDLENPFNHHISITVYWFLDGYIEYYSTDQMPGGKFIAPLDRYILDIPEFKTGTYEIKIYSNELFLISETFDIK